MATKERVHNNPFLFSIPERTNTTIPERSNSTLLQNVSFNTYTELSQTHMNTDEIQIDFSRYLDYFIKCPAICMRTHHDKKYRNGVCDVIGILFSLLLLITWIVLTYYDYVGPPSHFGKDDIVIIINIVLLLIFAAAVRLLAIYYLVKRINLKLRFKNNMNESLRQTLEQYLYKNKNELNQRLAAYISISIIFFGCWVAFFLGAISDKDWFYGKRYVDVTATFMGIQFPMILFPMIWSVLSLNYQFRLHYLQCLMNTSYDDTPDFALILKKYKSFYYEFRNEHKIWHRYFILYCCFYAIYIWIWSDIMIDTKIQHKFIKLNGLSANYQMYLFIISGGFGYFMPLLLYIISSSKINQQYNIFVHVLWKYDNFNKNKDSDDDTPEPQSYDGYDGSITSMESRCLLNKFGSKRKKDYMHKSMDINELTIVLFNNDYFHSLLEYVRQFPIQVTLFGVKLTYYAIFKFMATFLIAKYIAYNITILHPY